MDFFNFDLMFPQEPSAESLWTPGFCQQQDWPMQSPSSFNYSLQPLRPLQPNTYQFAATAPSLDAPSYVSQSTPSCFMNPPGEDDDLLNALQPLQPSAHQLGGSAPLFYASHEASQTPPSGFITPPIEDEPLLNALQPLQQNTYQLDGSSLSFYIPTSASQTTVTWSLTPPVEDDNARSPPCSLHLQQLQPMSIGLATDAAADAAAILDKPVEPEVQTQKLPYTRKGQKRKISVANEKAFNFPFVPTDASTDVFCMAAGRLCVVGTQRSYSVTVAEIVRRTRAPECIPVSLLGPLLKRAKVKGCHSNLKRLLQTRQISSGGDRRTATLSTLSSLVEAEVAQLANDHGELLHSHFPLVFLARLVVMQVLRNQGPDYLAATAVNATAAIPIVSSLSSLLSSWSCSSTSPLTSFCIVTHNLGPQEAILISSLFQQFLKVFTDECHKQLARIEQISTHGMTYPEIPLEEGPLVDGPPAKFAEVDGRLALQPRKYTVTVAEVARRLSAPECVNVSTLLSILRRGKSRNRGAELRDELNGLGIRVEPKKRGPKTTEEDATVTCFTPMLEEEALILARDLETATSQFLPAPCLAAELNRRAAASTAVDIRQRRAALQGASRLAALLSSTLTSLRLPVADRVPSHSSPYAHLMRDYSCLTHGYGPEVCVLFLESFRKVFDTAEDMLQFPS